MKKKRIFQSTVNVCLSTSAVNSKVYSLTASNSKVKKNMPWLSQLNLYLQSNWYKHKVYTEQHQEL